MFKPVFVIENVLVVLYNCVTTQSMIMAASTSYSSTNTSIFRKRSNPPGSDDDGPHFKASRDSEYYYVLQPESEPPTDEDPESIYSVQDKPTDSAKDTSDLSYSDDSNIVYTIGGDAGHTISPAEEYEPASLSEQEFVLPDVLSSASDSEHTQIVQTVGCELVKSLATNDEDTWADSSSSECEPEIDPELSLRDYWSCIQCKATNNNPLFRYCEKCFKVRKNFFPPRPKIKNNKKKKKKRNKQRSCHNDKINKNENKCHELLLLGNSNLSSNYTNVNQNISGQSLINSKNLSCSFSVENGSKTENLENNIAENYSQNLNDFRSANITEEINVNNSDLSIKSNLSTSSTVKLNNASYYMSSSSSGFVDVKEKISSSNDVCDNSNINSDLSDNVSFKNKTIQCSLLTSNKNNNNNYTSQLCETCLSRPKDGIFVHGRKIGHMFCCYQCSKKVWRDTGRCPLCNSKISQVLKVIS